MILSLFSFFILDVTSVKAINIDKKIITGQPRIVYIKKTTTVKNTKKITSTKKSISENYRLRAWVDSTSPNHRGLRQNQKQYF